jgi:hypothetical protein
MTVSNGCGRQVDRQGQMRFNLVELDESVRHSSSIPARDGSVGDRVVSY